MIWMSMSGVVVEDGENVKDEREMFRTVKVAKVGMGRGG